MICLLVAVAQSVRSKGYLGAAGLLLESKDDGRQNSLELRCVRGLGVRSNFTRRAAIYYSDALVEMRELDRSEGLKLLVDDSDFAHAWNNWVPRWRDNDWILSNGNPVKYKTEWNTLLDKAAKGDFPISTVSGCEDLMKPLRARALEAADGLIDVDWVVRAIRDDPPSNVPSILAFEVMDPDRHFVQQHALLPNQGIW